MEKVVTRNVNRCRICGAVLESLPFKLDNVICKECYGLDRYRRQIGPHIKNDLFEDILDEAA